MTESRQRWRVFRVAAVAVGLIALVFWLAISVIFALGIAGFLTAVYALPLVLATVGLFLVFSFLWQAFALARMGDLLERMEARMEKPS